MKIPLPHRRGLMSDEKLSEQDINHLIPEFYSRVRADAILGPIFDGAIADWPDHLRKLQDFWHSIMFTSGRYKGQPMVAHVRHAETMTSPNFERWLSIWRRTTDELPAPNAAATHQFKADRIDESPQHGARFPR